MTQQLNGHTSGGTPLLPPLRTAADMPSAWSDVELDFDAAADRLVRAHREDGAHRDLPIADLRIRRAAPVSPDRDGRGTLAA